MTTRIRLRGGVIGPAGHGKTLVLLSAFMALFGDRNANFANPYLSRRMRARLWKVLKERVPPDRTPPPSAEHAETFAYDWQDAHHDARVEWVAYDGEAIYRGDHIDADALREWVRQEQLDLVVFVVNPYELFPRLARVALGNVVMKFFNLGWTLGESIVHAVKLLFGRTKEGLDQMASGFSELPQAVRDVRRTTDRRGKNLATILEREGVPAADVAEVMRVLDLIVEAASSDAGEVALLRDLLRVFPRMVIAFSHMDLGEYTELTRADFDEVAAKLLAADRNRRLSDVVFTRQLHLELQGPPREPIFIRSLLPDGGLELWDAARPHLSEAYLRRVAPPPPPPTSAAGGTAAPAGRWVSSHPVTTAVAASCAAVLSLIACRALFGPGFGEAFFVTAFIITFTVWAAEQTASAARKAKSPAPVTGATAAASAPATSKAPADDQKRAIEELITAYVRDVGRSAAVPKGVQANGMHR
jgi:hypothetical protein